MSAQNLQKAKGHQKAMQANMGGTEIFGAMDAIYKQAVKPGYPRQVSKLNTFVKGMVSTTSITQVNYHIAASLSQFVDGICKKTLSKYRRK